MREPPREEEALHAISVIIPAYNEVGAITETIESLSKTLSEAVPAWEIIVVDDGSEDGTSAKLDELDLPGVRVLRHERNRGYGASLKTGIRNSRHPAVAITDADGTYPNERIPEFLGLMDDQDMVVGARVGKDVKVPLVRRPAKWFIGKLANYLVQYRIPDVNSGLRVFRKEVLERYLSILPDGFSFTTTITLAMLASGDRVKYVPIRYEKRVGRSKIKPIRDTLNFVQLIIRTVLLYEPLRIFLPMAFFLFLAGVGVLTYSWIWLGRVMDATTTLLFISALQMLAIGMIADMVNRRMNR